MGGLKIKVIQNNKGVRWGVFKVNGIELSPVFARTDQELLDKANFISCCGELASLHHPAYIIQSQSLQVLYQNIIAKETYGELLYLTKEMINLSSVSPILQLSNISTVIIK